MQLDLATWYEVSDYLKRCDVIVLPVGSTEQHGPIGLIGTDALCAGAIATRAAARADVFVAPTLAYTPAPFNAAFPGTMSVSEPVFEQLFSELTRGLAAQGFARIYVLNAHGANLAPMQRVLARPDAPQSRLRSWWSFDAVNALRDQFYGDWEGLHATPSEVAITQHLFRVVAHPDADTPPRALSRNEKRARAGDNHGTAARHKAEFPDGRVGAHSALARPEHGAALLDAAIAALAADIRAFRDGAEPV